eukprot:TRINITY_DN8898_c0_g1_i1.p1 TRINITY_DN8898_c0_g1~~TRINITY_DN8898_c0_g1_i1.p1  ORF type:complete len:576 (+),score=283.60 TRINITY_DN8898_c0_g1_i1:53-1780(+)
MQSTSNLIYIFCLSLLILSVFASPSIASLRQQYLNEGFEEKEGLLHYTFIKGTRQIVIPYPKEERLQKIKNYLNNFSGEKINAEKEWCPNNSYFDFLPLTIATLRIGQKVSWKTTCFSSNTATLVANEKGANITFQSSRRFNRKNVNLPQDVCSDFYAVASRESGAIINIGPNDGQNILQIANWSSDYEWQEVQQNGLAIFLFPCGEVGTIESIVKTVSLFIARDPQQLKLNNAAFLSEKMNFSNTPYQLIQSIDESLIQSGDYLAIARYDGLDPLIMFGTGGHTGHSAILLWERQPGNDTLYVLESTDKNPFGASYWPPPYGVIRTPYRQWIQQAITADYMVALLPIAPVWQSKFNEQNAWNWFYKIQGMPYGYHNFLYSWLDTFPLKNLPLPLDDTAFQVVFSLLDPVLNDSSISVYSLLILGLNKRLPTDCYTMQCINQYLDSQNLQLTQVTALPEQDEWVYGGNYSLVCSAFTASIWKNGFGSNWPTSQATEQTPKDNYILQVYDPNRWNENTCPIGLHKTPYGNYCQLMGSFVLDLPDYNSVPLYANANENCPSQWPSFFRCPENNVQCC